MGSEVTPDPGGPPAGTPPPGRFAVEPGGGDGAGATVLRVLGELDIATAGRLWERLEPAILDGPRRLVLDMAETTFIDSTGLTVLIRAHKLLGRVGGRLVLRDPAAPVTRVLTVSGLFEVLDVEDGRGADGPGG